MVYIPSSKRYFDKEKYSYENYKKIKKISKKLNIKFIDLGEYLLDNHSEIDQYYPLGGPEGHFSEYGYNKISKFIISHIKE